MSHYFDYLEHMLYDSSYYHRQYEHDLPADEKMKIQPAPDSPLDTQQKGEVNLKKGETLSKIKRAVLIALPFISLYRPAATFLSLGLGGCRCLTTGNDLFKSNALEAKKMGAVALSILAFASTLFNFNVGLLINTAADAILSFKNALQAFPTNKQKAFEELLQTVNSLFYLSLMLTGSLDLIFFSCFVQALTQAYSALIDWKEGKQPEAIAKLLMCGIRLNQSRFYLEIIRKRNALLAFEKLANLAERIAKGRKVKDLINSPLQELPEESILENEKGEKYNFGSNVHGFGKGEVKGMNLEFKTEVLGKEKWTVLEFKVNHVFREKIQGVIDDLEGLSQNDVTELLRLTSSHASSLTVGKVPFKIADQEIGNAYQITAEGLGSIYIGASKEFPNLYDKVVVKMSDDKSLYDLHELLSFCKLEDSLQLSSQSDVERLKLGHLFHTFFPKEATPLEREALFFDLPVDALKEEMIKRVPNMKGIVESYLPYMQRAPILDGKERFYIRGLSDAVYALGGRALTASITAASSDQELFSRVASILKMGMLSSEMRLEGGLKVHGLSTSSDFYTGGADSIYTQMLTQHDCLEGRSLFDLEYYNKVQLLFSLEALEGGTYQYHYDSFGNRKVERNESFWHFFSDYSKRPGILDFAKESQKSFYFGNEVMLKERVDPSFIKGIVVPDSVTKAALLNQLRASGVVGQDSFGHDVILGKGVDDFIRVGTTISEELIG